MDIERAIVQVLRAHPEIRVGVLFGSFAQGRAQAKSDVDLAIAGSTPLTAQLKTALIEGIAAETGRPVDVVDLQVAGGTILQQALAKGKLIYCTDRSTYAELIKRMLFEEADFMPYRRRLLRERREAWIRD